jgi:hypothetical protein
MIAESVLRSILRTVGFLTVFTCMAANAQPPTPSMPGQGFGFAVVGIAPGQSARINALNQLPSPAAQVSAGCRIALQFYDAEGQLIKEYVVASLAVGKSAAVDLNRDDLPSDDRLSLRAVLVFGYSGGANPPPQLLQQMATCNIVPSLEIYDNDTQKTSIVITDVKPLPGPSVPIP